MAEKTGKYFWLKLKENFFEDDTIRIVESYPDGAKYIVFYMKLMLKSIKTDGALKHKASIPYTPELLGVITCTEPQIAREAIELFQQFGLVEMYEDGGIYIPGASEAIGSESKSAVRMRRAREREEVSEEPVYAVEETPQCDADVTEETSQCDADVTEETSQCDADVTEETSQCDTDIEIDIEIDTEIEKEIKKTYASSPFALDAPKIQSGKSPPIKKRYSPEFENFWKTYPRKADKGSAYKKYAARLKDGYSESELLTAAVGYAEECRANRTEERYIKHPKTFLGDATPFLDYLGKKYDDPEPAEPGGNPFEEYRRKGAAP